MPPLPPRTDVLVVGAGPTGLAAALSLHKNGCTDITVVDCALASESTSRAVATHAATLEALDKVSPGSGDEIVGRGVQAAGGKLWDGYNFHPFGNFDVLKGHTKYPFILFCPQTVVESVLTDRVKQEGINVYRQVKVVKLVPNAENPNITDAIFEDGQVVQARYVIGADGTKSMVRAAAGISYSDPDGEDPTSEDVKLGVIADVRFNTHPPYGPAEALMCLQKGNFFLCLPLPSSSYADQSVFRIAFGVPVGEPPHAPPKDYLQNYFDAYGMGSIPLAKLGADKPLKIEEVVWSARFQMHSAIASTPYTRLPSADGKTAGGIVCLVGDAAHKHPPAGGQGMNLGIRDAVFLGPVLAQHLRSSTETSSVSDLQKLDEPVQAWANTRHERALNVIRMAKAAISRASIKDETVWYLGFIPVNWLRVRNFFLWIMISSGLVARVMPWQFSGLKAP